MPGFDSSAQSQVEKTVESAAEISRNSRVGLVLFTIYCVIYSVFVLINAFAPSVMADIEWAGINLATLYGFGLIGMALVLALVYGAICRTSV